MKLVIDCRYTRLGHHDGISRYAARVTEAVARRHPVTMLISDERQLEMLPDLPWVKISSPRYTATETALVGSNPKMARSSPSASLVMLTLKIHLRLSLLLASLHLLSLWLKGLPLELLEKKNLHLI